MKQIRHVEASRKQQQWAFAEGNMTESQCQREPWWSTAEKELWSQREVPTAPKQEGNGEEIL